MTPLIRDAIISTSFWLEGCFDFISVAVLSTTVSMALRPAAFIVSPDSSPSQYSSRYKPSFLPTRSTIPSATPNAQAASTLPPTNFIFVFNRFLTGASPFVTPFSIPSKPSNFAKYFSVNPTKLVTTFFPTSSSGLSIFPFSGTCTCNLHFPNPRFSTSSTPVSFVAGTNASCSATWSRPVIPRSTRPSPTKVGISAAGRNTRAMGWFLTRAMSRRVSRRNWMSEPARRSRVACWRRPSGGYNVSGSSGGKTRMLTFGDGKEETTF